MRNSADTIHRTRGLSEAARATCIRTSVSKSVVPVDLIPFPGKRSAP